MGVGVGGTMIHIREEGWKELKVGCAFDVVVYPTLDRHTKDMVELAHAVNNSYVAHLGGPEVFGQMVWAEATRRGWEQASDTEVVGDGTPWIWSLVDDYFYGSCENLLPVRAAILSNRLDDLWQQAYNSAPD